LCMWKFQTSQNYNNGHSEVDKVLLKFQFYSSQKKEDEPN